MRASIRRVLCAAFALGLAAALMPTVARADETGYWEYYDIEFENEEGRIQSKESPNTWSPNYNVFANWKLSNGSYTATFEAGEDYVLHGDCVAEAGDKLTSSVTYTGLVSKYRAGDTAKISYSMSGNHIYRPNAKEHHKTNIMISLSFGSKISYGHYEEDDDKLRFSEWRKSDFYDEGNDQHSAYLSKDSTSVSGEFAAEGIEAGRANVNEMRVVCYFSPMVPIDGSSPGTSTVTYYFRWHEADAPVASTSTGEDEGDESDPEEEDVYYRPLRQDEYVVASDDPDEDVSTGVISAIIEGFDPTEGGLFAVLGVATVTIGGATYLRYRRKRNKGKDKGKQTGKGKGTGNKSEGEEEKEQKKKSAYRMLVHKDFGGSLRVGGKPREVGARIEEIVGGYVEQSQVFGAPTPGPLAQPGAQVKRRDDLTQAITAEGEGGLKVVSTSFDGTHLVASVQVPTDAIDDHYIQSGIIPEHYAHPTVVFGYANPSKAGVFRQKVAFRLAERPEVVFVDERGNELAKGDCAVDALLGDASGSYAFFRVCNMMARPKLPATHPQVGGQGLVLSARCEPYPKLDARDSYGYRITLSNSHHASSPYGSWPLSESIGIEARNEEDGEFAEATVEVLLWPEGLSYDTSLVRPGWVRDDRIVVDTTDVIDNSTWAFGQVSEDYDLMPALVGLNVAYKDANNVVVVTSPTGPREALQSRSAHGMELSNPWLRLTAADDGRSSAVINDTDPRLWYDLRLWLGILPNLRWGPPLDRLRRMRSSKHGIYQGKEVRMGVVEVRPTLPLVTDRETDEYRGRLCIEFEGDARPLREWMEFGFTGYAQEEYESQRKALVKSINRLLRNYRTYELESMRELFARYGLEAEQVRKKLGSVQELGELGMTTDRLLKEVNQIQSVQRLNFIRQAVFEAGAEYVEGEGDETLFGIHVSHRTIGNYYRGWELVMTSERWAVDMMFTYWCYKALGPKATYLEPVLSPLKDWVLSYIEDASLRFKDEDHDVDLNPYHYFFNYHNFYNKFVAHAIENELLAILVGVTVTGGGVVVSWKKIAPLLGYAGCFFFFKNAPKHITHNNATHRDEFDLYGALRDTTADFTLFGVKAVISALLARKFARMRTAEKARSGELWSRFEDALACTPEDKVKAMMRAEERASRHDTWQAVYDAFGQRLATDEDYSVAAYVDGRVKPVADGTEKWVRDIGVSNVSMVGLDGKPIVVKVPDLILVSAWVEWAFDRLAELGVEISLTFGLVPERPEYIPERELIDKLEKIPGAQKEADALRRLAWGEASV